MILARSTTKTCSCCATRSVGIFSTIAPSRFQPRAAACRSGSCWSDATGTTAGCSRSPPGSSGCLPREREKNVIRYNNPALPGPGQSFYIRGKSSREELMKRSLTRRHVLAGSASLLAAPAIARAQGSALKVGVLLPRSGYQASIGQDCFRGVELAGPILKDVGLPELQIMNADTETNVDVARSRAEKLIADGAQLLIGAFDSGQSTAIAQVAEQKGIPYVINIAAAPPITEQGYKFVFRNFPTAPMILADAFNNQKEVFETAGATPKTVVLLHVNDTFGVAMLQGIDAMMPKFN